MVLVLVALVTGVQAHGNMLLPSTWFDEGGRIGMQPQLHCSTSVFSACEWFTNYTFHSGGSPTLDQAMWTYPKQSPWQDGLPLLGHYDCPHSRLGPQGYLGKIGHQQEEQLDSNAIPPLSLIDFFSRNPWRSPGTAPLHSSCGVAGGNPKGCPEQVRGHSK